LQFACEDRLQFELQALLPFGTARALVVPNCPCSCRSELPALLSFRTARALLVSNCPRPYRV